jgi:isopentenyl diphosphate isomerase/L-lactate dehydrogenase-like FMN-dependent dehydrogenase
VKPLVRGVATTIEILRHEVDVTLARMDVRSVRQLREGGRDLLVDRLRPR